MGVVLRSSSRVQFIVYRGITTSSPGLNATCFGLKESASRDSGCSMDKSLKEGLKPVGVDDVICTFRVKSVGVRVTPATRCDQERILRHYTSSPDKIVHTRCLARRGAGVEVKIALVELK